MNKYRIQKQAYQRMTKIEETCCDHVPSEMQEYWLLNFLIAEGLNAYIGSYGLKPLHLGDCNDGRHELGLGKLSPFEEDCINFLNRHINEADARYEEAKGTHAWVDL
jgi:hypothetical protein